MVAKIISMFWTAVHFFSTCQAIKGPLHRSPTLGARRIWKLYSKRRPAGKIT